MQTGFKFGLAYNHAMIDEQDPKLAGTGIDGDAQALLFGTRQLDDNWYAALTLSRLLNHETTNRQVYFDGWGAELYGERRIRGQWWVTGGWNILKPDGDQPEVGDYRLNYIVPGIRYTLDGLRRSFYFNYRTSFGSLTNGEKPDDVYTIGFRWDFPAAR